MAKSPVKFYSVTSAPTAPNVVSGAVYFVQGGELYKETQRFGLAKVFEKPTTGENIPENPPTTDVARGDIAIGWGAAKVYNGSTWVDLGADSSATDELAARVSTLETDVSDIKTVVSVVTSTPGEGEDPVTTTTVSATTGSFTNLTADSATFTATTLSATSMTVGGKTIGQIADERIAAITESYAAGSSNGIEVSVTTSGGNVTGVTVNAAAFANVVDFAGVITSGDLPSTPKKGDIVVIGTPNTQAEPPEALAQGLATGQEYIYTGDTVEGQTAYDRDKWEKIGDQNASTDIANNKVATGDLEPAEASHGINYSITLSNNSAGHLALIDVDAVTDLVLDYAAATDGDKLVTASAVTAYVGSQISNIGLGTAATADVLTFETGGTMGDENWASKSTSTALPTASQVYSLVSEKVGAVTADAVAFDYKNNPQNPTNITSAASTVTEAITALDMAVASALTGIDAINTSLSSLGDAAYKGVATSIGPSTAIPAQGTEGEPGYVPTVPSASDDKLATEKAVRDALDDVVAQTTLCWYEES